MQNKPILKNKLYLYFTEFFSGMAVMAVEIGASRLLAPFFSSSQIVWTIIIGTIMIAMALGNIYGGRKADKDPNPDKLYKRMIIAAIWLAAIPVFGKYIILGVSALVVFSVNTNYLIWAAFAACMIIFVFPLFLLGTVTPSLARYSVSSIDESGKVVGTLGAFNTVGSIIGTFLPTFVTIPAVGTSISFLLFAGVILIIALIYFISCKMRYILCAISVVLFVLCCVFGHNSSSAIWETSLAYEGESVYNYLQVKETDEEVILSTNVLFGVQSVLMKDDSSVTGMYYDYAMAAPFLAGIYEDEIDRLKNGEIDESYFRTENDQPKMKMLILGMGSGTYATQCSRFLGQNITVTGVEIDDKITELAYKYFELPEETEVITYDGRAYLNSIDDKYDIIMVDAYQDITIPFQMSSVEFFTLVKNHLNENGVMVVNMNMRGSEEGNINQYLADTIATVFNKVYTVDVDNNSNRELFASDNEAMMNLGLRSNGFLTLFVKQVPYYKDIEERAAEHEKIKSFSKLMGHVFMGMEEYVPGDYILTDDKAPVELLGMKVIDELIEEELEYYKDIYEEGGLKGLISEFQGTNVDETEVISDGGAA